MHALILLATGFALVLGAMATRRKIPLLSGSAAIVLVTLMKTVQWASHREFFAPLLGIGIGFLILGAGSALEAHMNRLIRRAVDRAKAEAQMFWVSWE